MRVLIALLVAALILNASDAIPVFGKKMTDSSAILLVHRSGNPQAQICKTGWNIPLYQMCEVVELKTHHFDFYAIGSAADKNQYKAKISFQLGPYYDANNINSPDSRAALVKYAQFMNGRDDYDDLEKTVETQLHALIGENFVKYTSNEIMESRSAMMAAIQEKIAPKLLQENGLALKALSLVEIEDGPRGETFKSHGVVEAERVRAERLRETAIATKNNEEQTAKLNAEKAANLLKTRTQTEEYARSTEYEQKAKLRQYELDDANAELAAAEKKRLAKLKADAHFALTQENEEFERKKITAENTANLCEKELLAKQSDERVKEKASAVVRLELEIEAAEAHRSIEKANLEAHLQNELARARNALEVAELASKQAALEAEAEGAKIKAEVEALGGNPEHYIELLCWKTGKKVEAIEASATAIKDMRPIVHVRDGGQWGNIATDLANAATRIYDRGGSDPRAPEVDS